MKYLCSIILLVILSQGVTAQKFEWGIQLGGVFSQVANDKLSGFNKLGFDAGVTSIYNFDNDDQFLISLSFGHLGSRKNNEEVFTAAQPIYELRIFSINTCFIYRKYLNHSWGRDNKIFLIGGAIVSRTLPSESSGTTFTTDGVFDFRGAEYNPFNLIARLGVGYKVNERIDVEGTLDSYLTSVITFNQQKLRPYCVGLRLTYVIN